MIDTNTNTSYCQNKWRIILWQERFKCIVYRYTDIPQLLNHCYVEYLCRFHYN